MFFKFSCFPPAAWRGVVYYLHRPCALCIALTRLRAEHAVLPAITEIFNTLNLFFSFSGLSFPFLCNLQEFPGCTHFSMWNMLSLSLPRFCMQHLGAINFPKPLPTPTHSSNTSLLRVAPVPSIIRLRQSRPAPVGKLSLRERARAKPRSEKKKQPDREKEWIIQTGKLSCIFICLYIQLFHWNGGDGELTPESWVKLLRKIKRGSFNTFGKM